MPLYRPVLIHSVPVSDVSHIICDHEHLFQPVIVCPYFLCLSFMKPVILDHLSSQPIDNDWLTSGHPGSRHLSFLLTMIEQVGHYSSFSQILMCI